MPFENKLVAIVNEKIEFGVAMNALAHISLALGAKLGKKECFLTDYIDKEQKFNWSISGMPFIILKGTSTEIKKAIFQAKEQNITQLGFTDTMTLCGTYEEQIFNTAQKTVDELVYYAGVLYGDFEKVKTITKRLSLFR
ncbi:MAG: hypothetical protein RL208_83 [Pseudomonadota bacterium]|jgi:hypothetical protein